MSEEINNVIESYRNKTVKALKDIVDINLTTLIASGETALCVKIEVDRARSSLRDEEWFKITCLPFGKSEAVELFFDKESILRLPEFMPLS